MALTKKHYEAIASTLKWYIQSAPPKNASEIEQDRVETGTSYAKDIAKDLASYFKQDNPRFQRDRFLQACGVEKKENGCKYGHTICVQSALGKCLCNS